MKRAIPVDKPSQVYDLFLISVGSLNCDFSYAPPLKQDSILVQTPGEEGLPLIGKAELSRGCRYVIVGDLAGGKEADRALMSTSRYGGKHSG
jgi:hypothetical protein